MRRVLPILLFPLLFLACDLGTPTTTTTTQAPTAIQINALISRSKDDYDITNFVTYWVYITNNGEAVSATSVTVNGVDLPVKAGWTPSYELTSETWPDATYAPGATYTVVVSYNGNTYTDSITAPGGITVNSESTQASWLYNGNASSVSINKHGFGTTTFSKSSTAGNLTNPLTIPSNAYPDAHVDYDLRMDINFSKNNFGSLFGTNAKFRVSDFWLKKVEK